MCILLIYKYMEGIKEMAKTPLLLYNGEINLKGCMQIYKQISDELKPKLRSLHF